ncbi:Rhodopsin, retinal binding site [Phaffia rhodozyma]|uniref:Rhodopsin, retinal binding site n=1 Tax=Phaffia rhodozyma TaxID=264483 RepID=A0A0F7SJJ9_PHARH|nr:Rhodopsin, retinal binding site [Phaffia rhodozyma]
MGNNAIIDNPNTSTLDLTTHGSDFLWAVCALMLLTDLIVIFWMMTLPKGTRVFHQISALILTTASIAYFTMASDLGSTPIVPTFIRGAARSSPRTADGQITRSIWYVRYIDWTVTTPLLLLEILLCTGLPLSDIVTTVFFDLVMIIGGLVGALITSRYKFGYFVGACFAMFYVFYILLWEGRVSAKRLSPGVGKSYTTSASILVFLWTLYPVAWILADGINYIATDSEMVFYGILDVLAKPVFCLFHLYQLRSEDLTVLHLQSGKVSDGVGGHYDQKRSYELNGGPTTSVSSVGAGTGLAAPVRPDNARRRTSERRAALEEQAGAQ